MHLDARVAQTIREPGTAPNFQVYGEYAVLQHSRGGAVVVRTDGFGRRFSPSRGTMWQRKRSYEDKCDRAHLVFHGIDLEHHARRGSLSGRATGMASSSVSYLDWLTTSRKVPVWTEPGCCRSP